VKPAGRIVALRDSDQIVAGPRARFSELLGVVAGLMFLAMVLVMAVVIVMRAVFGLAPPALPDLALYLHSGMILIGLPFALLRNAHVRIALGPRGMGSGGTGSGEGSVARLCVDLFGHFCLTLPFALLLAVLAWPYAFRSWAVGEAATDPGGLGFVYVVKFLIVLSGGLMAVCAVWLGFRAAQSWRRLR
jgi:TRAP-type mannitol/chloroaromatic compound transport system permease small subunit